MRENPAMHRMRLALMATLGAGVALLAHAQLPPGWVLYPLDERPVLHVAPSGDDGVRLSGEGAVSLAVKPVEPTWLSPDSCLSWRWRVDAGPPPTDLTQRGADDRAIALWIGFKADAESMTLAQRYAYGMIRFLSPIHDPAGFILAYTWGGAAPSAAWEPVPQPFLGQIVRQRVLRDAAHYGQGWVEETVHLAEDFRRAFGVPATQLMQLAVFADGDNTHSRTDVAVDSVRLSRCAPPAPPPVPAASPPRARANSRGNGR